MELGARMVSGRYPGLGIEKRVRLSQGSLITLEYALANRGRPRLRSRCAFWEGSIGGIPLRGISLRAWLKQEKLEGLEVEVIYRSSGKRAPFDLPRSL